MSSNVAHNIEPGPLSPATLEHLLGRLPADERARLAWAPKVIKAELQRLYDSSEAPSLALITEVSGKVMRAFYGCWRAILSIFDTFEPLQAELDFHWRTAQDELRRYLPDPASVDAAEWALVSGIAIVKATLAKTGGELPEGVRDLDGAALEAAASEPDKGAALRAHVLLMALTYGVEQDAGRTRAAELADLAVLETARVLEGLAAGGIEVDPFRPETTQERAARLLRYAEHVRAALDDDEKIFDEARLGVFR